MIAPLPQSQIPTATGEPVASTAEPESTSFADILASAMPVPQLPIPTPVPDPVPPSATALLASELDSDAPSAPAPRDDAVHPLASTQPFAEVFNEFGFFAADGPPADTAAAESQPDAMLESAVSPVQAQGAVRAESGPNATFALPAQASANSVAPELNAPHDAPSQANQRSSPVPGIVAPASAKVQFEEAVAAPATAASRRTSPRQAAARSAVQVTAREIEQGLHIAARIDALSESEREAMRDEILALLSRHGLALRTLRINGPIAATALQERKQR